MIGPLIPDIHTPDLSPINSDLIGGGGRDGLAGKIGGPTHPFPKFFQKVYTVAGLNTLKGHCMEWRLAHPLVDVEDIVSLADENYGVEADGITGRDKNIFKKNVTIASTVQIFDKGKEFLAVCRDYRDRDGDTDELMGFCWFDRGGYTTYSNDEISSAKFHHVDRKSTRLNSSHTDISRMPSSA